MSDNDLCACEHTRDQHDPINHNCTVDAVFSVRMYPCLCERFTLDPTPERNDHA